MVVQDPAHPRCVLAALASLITDPTAERLRVAVAYANVGGVRALQRLLATREGPLRVEIVVTLDMGITRKAALDVLRTEFEGTVMAITTPAGAGTFHAKAFVVDREGSSPRALVGSANLTDAALTTNYEAVTVTDLSAEATDAWEVWWKDLVTAADELTAELVDDYAERKPPPGRRERIADEETETDGAGTTTAHRTPGVDAPDAEWLVIDWGGTGEYRVQFEFPKAAAAFLRPPDSDSHRMVTLQHGGNDYDGNELAYYADNGMWRINMDPEIPPVADQSIQRGASLFERLSEDRYELRVLDAGERAAALAQAAILGGVGHTTRGDGTRREFGWGS